MKLRYKECPSVVRDTDQFNTHGVGEILMGDDSAPIRDLEIFVRGMWICLSKAFAYRWVVPNNHDTHFAEPRSPESLYRGWND